MAILEDFLVLNKVMCDIATAEQWKRLSKQVIKEQSTDLFYVAFESCFVLFYVFRCYTSFNELKHMKSVVNYHGLFYDAVNV
jgi:hypothetical protein